YYSRRSSGVIALNPALIERHRHRVAYVEPGSTAAAAVPHCRADDEHESKRSGQQKRAPTLSRRARALERGREALHVVVAIGRHPLERPEYGRLQTFGYRGTNRAKRARGLGQP